MQQMTWRAPDELLERVRLTAAAASCSLNEYVTRVLAAATDPSLAGSEAERVRERLAHAGLLVVPPAPGDVPPAPAVELLARARAEAGGETPLSEVVARARG